MMKLKAAETTGYVIKGDEYLLGGIIKGEKLVLMKLDKEIIPGAYYPSVFLLTHDELIEKIRNS